MYLLINTTVRDKVLLGLASKSKIISWQDSQVGSYQAERFLKLLDKLLKKNKVKLKDLLGIAVACGPGGFTAVRLGVAVANTLSYTLGIPAVGFKTPEFYDLEELFRQGIKKLKNKKGFSLVQPFYGQEPNITKPKNC